VAPGQEIDPSASSGELLDDGARTFYGVPAEFFVELSDALKATGLDGAWPH
jgi:hypothetical protein